MYPEQNVIEKYLWKLFNGEIVEIELKKIISEVLLQNSLNKKILPTYWC